MFRVAAGPRIGFGHLLRARALARALDVPGTFSIRGGRAATVVARALGCRVALKQPALQQGVDLLVLDDPSSPCIRPWIIRARRLGIRCVSVHDHARRADVDLAVDATAHATSRSTRVPLLAGLRFYILDERLRTARTATRHPSRRAPRVLIALGGGAHVRRVAQRLVDAVNRRHPGTVIAVAPGFMPQPRPPLKGARWLPSRPGLIGALSRCDVALVAGGVTLYEACALGVPAVGLAVVPAQQPAIRSLARRGAILDAGGPPLSNAAVQRAAAGVARLLDNGELRRGCSDVARRLVDGNGAIRVAQQIRKIVGLKVVREA